MEAEPMYRLSVRATRNGMPLEVPRDARDFGYDITRRTFTRTDAKSTLEAIQAAQIRKGKAAHQERRKAFDPPDLVIKQAGGIEYRIFPARIGPQGPREFYQAY